jgi:hypothetical protein
MGLFKDARAGMNIARDVRDQAGGFSGMRERSNERMAALNDMMTAQTATMTAIAADGQPATAQVVAVTPQNQQVNGQQVVQAELLIIGAGAPRPVTTTLFVPPLGLGQLQAGANLSVTVSASNPQAVAVNWGVPA